MSIAPATLAVERSGERVVARVGGEIDLANAAALGRRIDEALDGARSAAVDVGAVGYLDSQGVRLLHALAQRLTAAGVDLVVVAPAASVAGRVLELTRLGDVAPVRESLDG